MLYIDPDMLQMGPDSCPSFWALNLMLELVEPICRKTQTNQATPIPPYSRKL